MSATNCATAFLGLSHLGIVQSIGWASFGQPVVAVDPDPATVERLIRHDLPVREPGLPEVLERSRPWITFSADLSRLGDCPLVIVARDVPTDSANATDLGPVLDLIDAAVPYLRPHAVVVLMSQVPPGFTRSLEARVRSARPDLPFTLYYWMEMLVFGDAVRRCLEPERFIVGAADPDMPLPRLLGRGLERFGCPVLRMSYESAELTKTAINLYLAGAVTYTNLLADVCGTVGADWGEVAPALRLDKRIGAAAYLQPGLGIAGGNLERDLCTLRDLCLTHGIETTYLDALIDCNARRLDWARRKLAERVLGRTPSPTIGVWGLTYKKNTLSTKNSPALRLIAELDGRAKLLAWDPAVGASDVETMASIVRTRDEALTGSDCLLIMADWDHFADADFESIRRRMRRPLVIDCVGALNDRRQEMEGIEYVSMGR
jgi:UDPglucose 6-dehydrogenase